MTEWYEAFFDALAFDVWAALVPAETTAAEASFLLRHLCDGAERRRLLDVPCGDGRLALPVAAAGHDVVGVDLSAVAIDRLRQSPVTETAPVTALLGDMRDLGAALGSHRPFDGAWCMGNSFGYLDTRDTLRFLEGLAALLRPGGRFVLDAATVAECVLPALGPGDRYEAGDALLVNVSSYDARRSTVVTDMTLAVGQRQAQRVVRHRVMTCREIVDSMEGSGLLVDQIFGGLDDEPFVVGSPRCLVVATRS